MPTGQGHETTLAQVAADALELPFERVRVVLGDTQTTPFYYFGTGASRSSNMGANAVLKAAELFRQRLVQLGARQLGEDAERLSYAEGAVTALDGSAGRTLEQLGAAVYSGEAAGRDLELVDVLAYYDPAPDEGGWAASTHLALVEVDPRFGTVAIRRYLVVEDCGIVINPAVVEGQIRGGIAQGIGVTLLEHSAYDTEGQPLAGTYITYVLPKAEDMPEIEIEHLEIPTDDDFSARGVGESGMVMAPAALANAIEDALRPRGVRVEELPLTPTRLLGQLGELDDDTLAVV